MTTAVSRAASLRPHPPAHMVGVLTRPAAPRTRAFPRAQTWTVHGYRRAYRVDGSGPAVLLLHGIGDNSETWRDVMPALANDHMVIAPDMLGHGQSAKPRGDYSVGGFANGMRDLLSVLEVERVTVIGHSLGAGVAMQFAYQYPERCERLVLVGAGGVSRSVHPMLRAASLPGASTAIGMLRLPFLRAQVRLLVAAMRLAGMPLGLDAADMLRIVEGLPDAEAREAFTRTLRTAVDARGQIVTMLDRCYLAETVPTLLVWGSRDTVVPVHHARIAHAALPGSRLELFEGAGHFPFRQDPERFVSLVREFIASTVPAPVDPQRWRTQLRRGRQGVGLEG